MKEEQYTRAIQIHHRIEKLEDIKKKPFKG